MDLLYVGLFFLVLFHAAGSTAINTIVRTTDRNRTVSLTTITPSHSALKASLKVNKTNTPLLTTSSGYGTFNNSLIMVTTSVYQSSYPAPTPSSISYPRTTILPVGFCAKYNREPCKEILAKSLTEHNETERYFDSNHGINGSVKFLELLLSESESQVSDKRCKWLIEVSLCQYTLSPCKPNGEPFMFCREDCESLTSECKASLNRLIGSAAVLKHIKGYDFAHLVLPSNCSFYASGKTHNRSCIYLGLFDHSNSKTTSSKTNQDILWIAVGSGSAFLTIIFMVILTCSMKRRKRKKKKKQEIEEIALRQNSKVDSASTMKTRLSQFLEMHSMSSKIAELYDPSKLKQFSLDNIEYLSDLGEGQFGLVFKGAAVGIDEYADELEQTVVAVKTLKTDCNQSSKDEFNQEVALMSVLDHPNVVKLLAVATEEEPYCMIFEFMEFGDLNQFLRKIKPLDETDETPEIALFLEDFLSICQQVASGMSYLSTLHFIHRDLATRNCLVGKGIVVKIADFGLARDIYSSDYYKVRGDAMLPVRWMPPEAVLHGKFTVASDIYSYGILMWEVFTYALQPYYGYTNEEVIGFAKQGVLLGQPEECPDHIYKLMLDCWQRTPDKRPDYISIIKRLVKDPPPMSDYSSPRSISLTAEELRDNDESLADEPLGKIPVPKPVKPQNHYISPGSLVNTGYKSDEGEGSGEKAQTLPVVRNESKDDLHQSNTPTSVLNDNIFTDI